MLINIKNSLIERKLYHVVSLSMFCHRSFIDHNIQCIEPMFYTLRKNYILLTYLLNTMHYSFIQEETPTLMSERMRITQVTTELLQDVNFLMRHSNGHVYNTNITPNTLKRAKYFIGYVDDIPVAITGFRMVRWGYTSFRFTTTGSVTSESYRREGYMTELKSTLFKYITELGVCSIYTCVHKNNIANISIAMKFGFVKNKMFKSHVFMRLTLHPVKRSWRRV